MADIVKPNVTADPDGDKKFLEDSIKGAEKPGVAVGLSAHIANVFADSQDYFKPHRQNMVRLLRRCKGEYEPDKLRDIKSFQGTEAFLRSGETKARAAESWIKDIYADKNNLFDIKPTAVPEIPTEDLEIIQAEIKAEGARIQEQAALAELPVDKPALLEMLDRFYNQRLDQEKKQMMRDAKKRCNRAAKLIKDDAQEGDFETAFNDFLWYFTRLSFGILKGPILTQKKKHKWVEDASGVAQFLAVDTKANETYSVNPFNFFPSRGMTSINDGSTIELHQLSAQTISGMRKVPGYSEEEIDKVIDAYRGGSLKPKWFTLLDETEVKNAQKDLKEEKRAQVDAKDLIWAQEFYGPVDGRKLLDWGINKGKSKEDELEIDPNQIYQANCWKIDKYVIKAVINPDDLGRKPYHISSWSKSPDNLIGEGLIEFGSVVEDALNGVVRALINNIAIASGPMCEIDSDRVDADTPMFPWRQIKSTSRRMQKAGQAVHYYQPDMNVQQLIQAFRFFSQLMDEMTVPAYAQGAAQSGVTAGTATVFTELLAAASRSIKAVIGNIDTDIIKPYVQMSYDRHMSTTTDESVKGDANIVPGGVGALKIKEQQAQRKVEFLQITANPVLQQILGQENLGSIMAQVAASNDIDLPDSDRLDGTVDMQSLIDKLLMGDGGMAGQQANGQMGNGGGAPTAPQVLLPNGAQSGVAQ